MRRFGGSRGEQAPVRRKAGLPWAVYLLLLLAGLPQGPCLAQCDSLALAKADTLLVHDNPKAAAKAFQKLVDQGTCVAYAYHGLAACAQQRGEPHTQVLDLLTKAIDLAPTDPFLLKERSNVYYSIAMFDRSFADLEEALKYQPVDSLRADYMADQGWDLMNMRRPQEAHAVLLKAYALDSTNGSVINNLSLACDDLKLTDEAYHWIDVFIATDTTDPTGYLNKGFLLAANGRYAEALGSYDRAEKMGAADGRFFNNRGYAKLMSGDTKGALDDIERSLKIYPGNSYAYRNKGLAYQAMDKHNEACTAFEEALSRGYTKQFGDDVKQAYDAYCH